MNAGVSASHTQPTSHFEGANHAECAERQWDISGLTCSADAVRLERRLQSIAGVISVVVNPVTERAYVTFDASQVSPQELLDGIKDAGFSTP